MWGECLTYEKKPAWGDGTMLAMSAVHQAGLRLMTVDRTRLGAYGPGNVSLLNLLTSAVRSSHTLSLWSPVVSTPSFVA